MLGGEPYLSWRLGPTDARLMDPICPHLGADLTALGEVVDGPLRCPFHGFRFDETGRCVVIGYDSDPPGRVLLNTAPVALRHGR